MPRLPYLTDTQLGDSEVAASIRATRRNGRLLNLDRQLLYSPVFARGWGALLWPVRTQLDLPVHRRELLMCAVGILNNARYELHHHGPLFLQAGGTQAQLAALEDVPKAAGDAALFDATGRALLQLAVEMTRNVEVSDATFAAVRAALPDERQVVEAIAVVAAYNMVSRFLVALGVEPE